MRFSWSEMWQRFPFLPIPLALFGVALFFSLYSRFLLDLNLQGMRTSLSILSTATAAAQAESALLLLDQALTAEMAKPQTDLKTLAALQYTKGSLATPQAERPVEDAKTMVSVVAEEQETSRSGFLKALDGLVTGVGAPFRRETFLPHRGGSGISLSKKEEDRFRQGLRLERLGSFAAAAAIYEELLKSRPIREPGTALKLRLGYTYQRTQQWNRAERFYRQALGETQDATQGEVARQALAKLTQIRGQEQRAKILERRMAALVGPERQRTGFELGLILIQSYALEKAARAFHEAALAFPEGALALPSLFKEAWCLRTAGKLEEAFLLFKRIIDRDPKSPWAAAAQQQIAEAYKTTGDYTSAAVAYEQALKETGDKALQATLRLQTGWTYLYDLEDPSKAQVHLGKGGVGFSAQSPFGSEPSPRTPEGTLVQPVSAELTPVKPVIPLQEVLPASAAESLEAQTPLADWLGKFLPIFVQVFEERLTQYMKSVNIKKLERRYTEPEFKELVVRRVRERFPGQVTDVDTKIHRDGFVGSGKVRIGPLEVPMQVKIGIQLVEERPHALVREVKVGALTAPEALLKLLEQRINQGIDEQPSPLRVKKYELNEGYALIAVELVEEG